MANIELNENDGLIHPWTKEGEAAARAALHASEWYQTRPDFIKAAIDQCPPYFLYRLNRNNVYLYSYEENGEHEPVTVKVIVAEEWNPAGLFMERMVFGVSLDELTPIALRLPE